MISLRTKFIFKVFLFVGSCMLLCSCPGGNYMKYDLVGEKGTATATGFNNYDQIITNKSDTILVKVGVVESLIYKTTAIIVRFEDLKNNDFEVFSTKYGQLSLNNEQPNLYRKTINSIKRKDTVVISLENEKFYFTR